MNKLWQKIAAPLGLTFALFGNSAVAAPVDLELALLIDTSGSINNTEYALQMNGYRDAFNSAAVQNAIASGALGSIAVSVVHWSGRNQQVFVKDWELVTAANAGAFGDSLGASQISQSFFGNTAPGSAINYVMDPGGTNASFSNNGFEGSRWVIDVSGDGKRNSGANTADARDDALAAGVHQINGLPIGGDSLKTWYINNIQGGTGSFTIAAANFENFAEAITQKLAREITGVPLPGTLALFLVGMFALQRRRAAVA
jgi:hypothetical protein